MKSLLSPALLSSLPPRLARNSPPFSLFSSVFCTPNSFPSLKLLRLKLGSMPFRERSVLSIQSRAVQTDASSSGEIHVIVGPMFAGKTTNLLRRIQAEKNNDRLVRYSLIHFSLLVLYAYMYISAMHLNSLLRGLFFIFRV